MGRLLSDDDYDNMLSHDVFDEDHIYYTFDARSVILSLSHSMKVVGSCRMRSIRKKGTFIQSGYLIATRSS